MKKKQNKMEIFQKISGKFWEHQQYSEYFRHESRKHECIHCGFHQSTLKLLESHFKTEGPFHNNKCTQCSARFTSHEEYKQHVQASHFGQWLHICGICEKKFNELGQLKDHRTVEHKIAKPKITKTGQG